MISWMQWNHFPWKIFSDPKDQWSEMPTFLAIEYCCFIMTIFSLIHALKNSENHCLVWIASFITGTANDIFFMALPFVDNFWQAQSTIMLTPRLPLYICCIYNVFLYYSMVSSWRFGIENPLPEAAITGFLALLIYFPYDFIGVKHLWWTWHTTDPCIKNRIMGVPIGSSMWILTFSASFSAILYICRGKLKLKCLPTIVISALFTTPMMMVIMSIIQLISLEQSGVPSIWGFCLCIFIYAAIIIISSLLLIDTSKSYKWIEHKCLTKFDCYLGLILICYFSLLIILGIFGKPETFNSMGVHQTYGPCDVTVMDFTGLTRDKYVCQKNIPMDWSVSCTNSDILSMPTNVTVDWYNICGTPHTNEIVWKNTLITLCLTAILIYSITLIYLPFRSKRRMKVKER